MNPATDQSAAFPLLADPRAYRACTVDLLKRGEQRDYWINLFRSHFPTLLDAYRAEADDRGEDAELIDQRAADAHERFFAWLDQVERDPGMYGHLDILSICDARERVLRAVGIDDAYRLAKRTDTAHALPLLPGLLEELDAMPETQRRVAIMQGVFAGNIYDLGATATVEMFTDQRVDFRAVRDKLKPRPWRFDDLDLWLKRLDGPPHRAAVLFVDNAGPDVTLGMLPLARELLKRGTKVVLTANPYPSLNDVTHDELVGLMDAAAEFDAVFRDAVANQNLLLVPSGNHCPLIDLKKINPELAVVVESLGVDLVVLEGMGRAIESNFTATFTCDTLKLAMLKDLGVAKEWDAELFDLVMKFEPAPE